MRGRAVRPRTLRPQLRRDSLGSTPDFITATQSLSMLSRFTVVLLDMNGTFMFGGDRFGPEQNYADTYHALGGRRLAARSRRI
jgi:hypothetical protein